MSELRSLVIRNGFVVDAKAHKLNAADILIEGDTIKEMGRPGMPAPASAQTFDANGKALMPGLVNSHTHAQGNLAKALGDRINLELLQHANPWMNRGRTLEDKYLSAKIGAVEMLLRGCTSCYDMFNDVPAVSREGVDAVARAYHDVGMRAVVAVVVTDRIFYRVAPGLWDSLPEHARAYVEGFRREPANTYLTAARDVFQHWRFDRERVGFAIGPNLPTYCSDDLLRGCWRLSEDYEIGLQTHLDESPVWAAAGVHHYGKTTTAHLNDLGIINERFTGAHSVCIDADDMRLLADKGASIAHNPGSNLRLGSGIARVRQLMKAGVNVGLGTDSCNCSDHLNMFESMRLASYVSRIVNHDPKEWLSTEDVMVMATEGSARALGMAGRVGRLAPGYKADIVFLNLDDISFVPRTDITNQIVHCADTTAIASVMVGGRMVVDRGRPTLIDYPAMVRDANAAIERLMAANADLKKRLSGFESAVSDYSRKIREQRSCIWT